MKVLRGLKLLLFMTCRDAAPLISQSMDKRLDVSDRAAVRVHLAICSSCRRYRGQLALLRRVLLLIHSAAHPVAAAPFPPDRKARVRTALERRSTGRSTDS